MDPILKESSARIHTRHSFTARELVLGGMFASFMAAVSQISLPMPTGMPITIQVFGVTLIGVVLGWRLALLATVTYILIGAVGLPVFANFRGGLGSLVGVTGGYIWSWPIMAALCGIQPKTGNPRLNTVLILIFSLLGLTVAETIGCLQWAFLSGDMSVGAVFAYAMIAFIPKDILLTTLGVMLGLPMRKIVFRAAGL